MKSMERAKASTLDPVFGLPMALPTSDLYQLDKVDWRGRPPLEGAQPVSNVENSQDKWYMGKVRNRGPRKSLSEGAIGRKGSETGRYWAGGTRVERT